MANKYGTAECPYGDAAHLVCKVWTICHIVDCPHTKPKGENDG